MLINVTMFIPEHMFTESVSEMRFLKTIGVGKLARTDFGKSKNCGSPLSRRSRADILKGNK